MIPAIVISREEAEKRGLCNSQGGGSVFAAGFVSSGKIGQDPVITEKTLLRTDGTMELLFMADERKKEMQDKNTFAGYLDHFHVIEGMKKEDYFKKNNLK